ncbi:MAG: MaoC family dehydratase N-terminal domain-containing protein [Novosphingobium sp.]|nr:MaoC family dehydratase N-terminal domain-containing protein [Novosphingobium sp.]MCP5404225.1 MaoC family dehydratase N-terminal domain-containing protein [Novosphingobium sp.]
MSEDFSSWIGKSETASDVLEPSRSNAITAALGVMTDFKAGDPLPLLHHWLYFWNVQPPEGLGKDGHPAKGGFLPPVALPRRMWAGGRLRFENPLRFGDEVTRTSTILKVQEKSGKSGQLVFVTVEHKLAVSGETAVIEEQDLVYREAAAPGSITGPSGEGPQPQSTWHRTIFPDEVLLFRYSALTMNGHRIHYDLPYARDEEAYPALVVQGPLQATCLAAMAQRELGRPLKTFEFRGMSPAFAGTTLHVCGEPSDEGVSVWTEQGGAKCMTASAG